MGIRPFVLFSAMLPVLAASPAKADFRVCNDTGSLVGVALGYSKNGTWFTEGWWQVPGETCASLLEGSLASRFYYIYAEDADRGGQWRGDIFMCTSSREFVIEGKRLEREVAAANMDDEAAVRRLHRKLERMGVLDALKELGISHGDTVRIGAVEFDYAGEDEVG